MPNIKLMSLNIWGGRLSTPLLDLLNAEQPDIVCFQEVIDAHGDVAGFFTPVSNIIEVMKPHDTFMSPVFSFRFMRRELDFGNLIASRYPMAQKKTIFTRKQFTENLDINEDDYNIRNFQHATIRTKSGSVHVLNYHGHHIDQHKNGDAETLRQCKEVNDYIAQLKGKVILAGDFNLSPHSESLEILNSSLNNLCIRNKIKTTRNALTKKSEVCDYIFVNSQVEVRSFSVLDALVSDHSALILEF